MKRKDSGINPSERGTSQETESSEEREWQKSKYNITLL